MAAGIGIASVIAPRLVNSRRGAIIWSTNAQNEGAAHSFSARAIETMAAEETFRSRGGAKQRQKHYCQRRRLWRVSSEAAPARARQI